MLYILIIGFFIKDAMIDLTKALNNKNKVDVLLVFRVSFLTVGRRNMFVNIFFYKCFVGTTKLTL